MATENPFYKWSIVEAWDWLVHLPVAGFALLVALGLYVLTDLFVIYVMIFPE